MRPDSDKILSFPHIQKRMSEKHVPLDYDINEISDLLQTIKLPKNLGLLTDNLPKPTYNDFKEIKGLGRRVRSHENSLIESDTSALPSINNSKRSVNKELDSSRRVYKNDESHEIKSDEEEAGARTNRNKSLDKDTSKLLEPAVPMVQKKELLLNISPDKD
jgi:hypothetical protein